MRYYDDVLNVEQELPKVDTKAAGRKPPAEEELAKLMRLVLGAIAKSPENDAQIGAMQSLPYADQMVLMRVIESVLATLQAPQEAEEEEAAPDISTDMNQRELESMRRELAKKTELVNLHQDQLASAEAQIERLTEENKEMNAVLPGLRDSERERDTFRDQLDESRPIIEQSKRQEVQIEKYRSRLEETSDLQRELQDLRTNEQDPKTTAGSRSTEADERAKHIERRYTSLQEEYTALESEKQRLQAHCDALEADHKADQTQMKGLMDRVQAFEIQDGSAKTEREAHDPDTITALRGEVSDLQQKLELSTVSASSRQSVQETSDSIESRESSLAAVHAEITAMRNNARSKEKEAQYVVRLTPGPFCGSSRKSTAQTRARTAPANLHQKSFVLCLTSSRSLSSWTMLLCSDCPSAGTRRTSYARMLHLRPMQQSRLFRYVFLLTTART